MDRLPKIKEFVEEKVVENIMDIDSDENEEDINLDPDEPDKMLPSCSGEGSAEDFAIKPREKVSQDIFGGKSNSQLEVKKVKKPKREISEAQKERLKIGRAKGLATRRRNAELKKQGKVKEPPFIDKSNDTLKEELKVEKPLKEELRTDKPSLTKEDIEDITANASQKALEDYEILRKKRKADKKEKLAVNNHRLEVRETIRKATARDTTYDFCFQ